MHIYPRTKRNVNKNKGKIERKKNRRKSIFREKKNKEDELNMGPIAFVGFDFFVGKEREECLFLYNNKKNTSIYITFHSLFRIMYFYVNSFFLFFPLTFYTTKQMKKGKKYWFSFHFVFYLIT